jgi:hypothetical protein
MAWVTPQYSKVRVNRAGELMVRGTPADFPDMDDYISEYFDALDIVNNWRSSHRHAILCGLGLDQG